MKSSCCSARAIRLSSTCSNLWFHSSLWAWLLLQQLGRVPDGPGLELRRWHACSHRGHGREQPCAHRAGRKWNALHGLRHSQLRLRARTGLVSRQVEAADERPFAKSAPKRRDSSKDELNKQMLNTRLFAARYDDDARA